MSRSKTCTDAPLQCISEIVHRLNFMLTLATWLVHMHMCSVAMIISRINFSQYESNCEYFMFTKISRPNVFDNQPLSSLWPLVPKPSMREDKPVTMVMDINWRSMSQGVYGETLQAAMSLDVCRCAPEPQYTILREPVEGELPEFLIMEVQLPGIVSPLLFLPSFLLAAVVWGLEHGGICDH